MDENKVKFILDGRGNKTHAVLPIAVYRSLLSLREMLSPRALPSGEELYFFRAKGLTASGYPTGERSHPYFMVIRGSQASLKTVSSVPPKIVAYREKLIDSGCLSPDPEHSCLVFTKDHRLPSASFAATLIAGNIRNGMDVWLSREGFSLKESGFGLRHR